MAQARPTCVGTTVRCLFDSCPPDRWALPQLQKLLKLHEIPMASLEFVTMASSDDRQHHLLGGWKDLVREDGLEHAPDHFLYRATVALSSYLEAQAPRLLAESPVITVVSTNASLIACALRIASQRGWFAPNVVRTGLKRSDWSQRDARQEERLQRSAADWIVDEVSASGRVVVLLDDIFVTGATMFSYAAALRRAGAIRVLAVAYERVVSGFAYYDALRWARDEHNYLWSPDAVEIARFPERR